MMTREDLVRQRKLEGPPIKACPVCLTGDIHSEGIETTTIGSIFGEPDVDQNHVWHHMRCCHGHAFVFEERAGNHWVTVKSKTGECRVVAGMPSCFESYTYSCIHCDGNVRRSYTELDGVTPTYIIMSRFGVGGVKTIHEFRTFYACEACQKKIEVEST